MPSSSPSSPSSAAATTSSASTHQQQQYHQSQQQQPSSSTLAPSNIISIITGNTDNMIDNISTDFTKLRVNTVENVNGKTPTQSTDNDEDKATAGRSKSSDLSSNTIGSGTIDIHNSSTKTTTAITIKNTATTIKNTATTTTKNSTTKCPSLCVNPAPPHIRNLPKTQSLDLADDRTDDGASKSSEMQPFTKGMMPKFDQTRPIYPNVPYSPYGSPYGSPRSGRRRPPLRESRRISIEQTGSFLQLNQYKLMDQIGQVST